MASNENYTSYSDSNSTSYERGSGSPSSYSPALDPDFNPDMRNEYTCFLCNGYQTVIGTIIIDSVGIELVDGIGRRLELEEYDQLVSVNEPEPYSFHSLILVYPTNRYVVLSHLLRKSQLVEVFKNVGLYREEPKLPFEAIGFYDPERLNEQYHSGRDFLDIPYEVEKEERWSSEEEEERHPRRRGGNPRTTDQWSNKEEQERYMQREIATQSMLNPIQMLSSEDHARKKTVSSGEWKQLDKYHSSPAQAFNKTQPSTTQRRAVVTIKATLSPGRTEGTSFPVRQVVKVDELVDQLKTLFPDHSNAKLKDNLRECGYDLNDTITMILSEDQGDSST